MPITAETARYELFHLNLYCLQNITLGAEKVKQFTLSDTMFVKSSALNLLSKTKWQILEILGVYMKRLIKCWIIVRRKDISYTKWSLK